jgi:hypothetical protein
LSKAREMAGRMSISGVQPKLSVARQGRRLVPVSAGGQFILKPQTATPLLFQALSSSQARHSQERMATGAMARAPVWMLFGD